MPEAGFPPAGFRSWACDVCTATCTFEAMTMCVKRHSDATPCGYDKDPPVALSGYFEFITVKEGSHDEHGSMHPRP